MQRSIQWDTAFSNAEAIAIANGKFIGVGSSKEILLRFTSKEIADAGGKPVYPGFIDAHCHFYGYALSLQQVDLTGTKSFQDILELLKKQIVDDPEGWLVGRGWDQNDWPDKGFPDRKELDLLFSQPACSADKDRRAFGTRKRRSIKERWNQSGK